MSAKEDFSGPEHKIIGVPEGNQPVSEFIVPDPELEALASNWPNLTQERQQEIFFSLPEERRMNLAGLLLPPDPTPPEVLQEILDKIKRERDQ